MQPPDRVVYRAWRTHDARPGAQRRQQRDAVAEIIDAILPADAERVVLLGPVVECPPQVCRDCPPYYFVSVSNDGEVFPICVGARTWAEAAELHEDVRARLLRHWRKPAVHLFTDEVMLMEFAEEIWPGEATAALLQQIQAERRRN